MIVLDSACVFISNGSSLLDKNMTLTLSPASHMVADLFYLLSKLSHMRNHSDYSPYRFR